MKKMIALISAIAIMAALTGCGAKDTAAPDLELSEFNDVEINDKVELYIKQRTITDETEQAALSIVNLTDKEYTFDAVQRLEVKHDGQWYVVPDNFGAAILSLYFLPAEGTEEFVFYFAEHYASLSQGEYRIVKQFTSDDGDTAIAAAEFRI